MGIRPMNPQECGATCLWVVAWNDGRVLAGRLGDGMILVDKGGDTTLVMEEEKSGFANQTNALAESGILSKWETRWFDLSERGTFVCLLTDGISEDLKRDQLSEVVGIFRQLSECSSSKGERFLRQELEVWATPGHQDDKTVAVLFRR
jgi:serine/threonine protein phosphatase PrpC